VPDNLPYIPAAANAVMAKRAVTHTHTPVDFDLFDITADGLGNFSVNADLAVLEDGVTEWVGRSTGARLVAVASRCVLGLPVAGGRPRACAGARRAPAWRPPRSTHTHARAGTLLALAPVPRCPRAANCFMNKNADDCKGPLCQGQSVTFQGGLYITNASECMPSSHELGRAFASLFFRTRMPCSASHAHNHFSKSNCNQPPSHTTATHLPVCVIPCSHCQPSHTPMGSVQDGLLHAQL
jgi:hypothetical protein